MFKKVILIAAVVCLSGIGPAVRANEQKAPSRSTSRRPRFGEWFEKLEEAYKQNDKEKMGELIEGMKQRRQQPRRTTTRDPRTGRVTRPVSRMSPEAQKESEKKIMAVLNDMHENQRRGMMNVPPDDGRLLRLLAETTRARRIVEIGTSNGYSGIWFCLALQKTGGKLITHEINAERANLARENFKRAGVEASVELVEGDAHEKIKEIKGPIDIVFLDADKSGYIDYLNKLLPSVRPGGLIIAHNTTDSGSAMQDYIKAVTTNDDLETMFLRKQPRGIGVTLKKR